MRPIRTLALGAALAATVWGQQFKFNLEHLAAKASDSVDVSLDSSLLQFAAKFFNGKDPDEAKVKKLLAGITGIYVKSFEFQHDGGYLPADLEKVRSQLKAPEWSRIIGVKSSGDNENIEIWVRNENGKVSGVAILASEPRQLTVANLVGNVDLDSLADLGGHFSPQPAQSEEEVGCFGRRSGDDRAWCGAAFYIFVIATSISNFLAVTGSSKEATTVGLPGGMVVSMFSRICEMVGFCTAFAAFPA